jgi:Uracil DNA glycosylase superfamily
MRSFPASRERLRRRYRPEDIRLLFIGESPPASGRFFYQRDSGLYRAVRDAFRAADPSITDDCFLEIFKSTGCYLIDVCAGPVDHLDIRSRRSACLAGEPALARKIRQLRPAAIVTLVKSIRDNIRRAADRAGWRGPILEVPYPGRWASHRKVFLELLAPRLEKLVAAPRSRRRDG